MKYTQTGAQTDRLLCGDKLAEVRGSFASRDGGQDEIGGVLVLPPKTTNIPDYFASAGLMLSRCDVSSSAMVTACAIDDGI